MKFREKIKIVKGFKKDTTILYLNKKCRKSGMGTIKRCNQKLEDVDI